MTPAKTVPALLVALALAGATPGVRAQTSLVFTPSASGGPYTFDGKGFRSGIVTASVGIAVETDSKPLRGYARTGLRSMSSDCEDSDPPTCTVPRSALAEFVVGGKILGERWVGVPVYLGFGGGMVSWMGRGVDPMIELELGVDLAGPGSGVRLALRGLQVWVSERGTEVISSEKRLDIPEVLVGFRLPL